TAARSFGGARRTCKECAAVHPVGCGMTKLVRRAGLIAALCNSFLVLAGCKGSTNPRTSVDVGPDAGSPDSNNGADRTTGPDPDAATPPDAAASNVAVTLAESAFTLATPDLSHPLIATVTG